MKLKHLYRVFPWLEEASRSEPGHPLYVHEPQGAGRVDNPERYSVLYASDVPGGAVGEAFGNLAMWTAALLAGSPLLPGSRRALVTYEVGDSNFLDLDEPRSLASRRIRPSRVVTRDRAVTQTWALSIFEESKWDGVRWWSFHYPEWGSYGIWDHAGLSVSDIRPLSTRMEIVEDAATLLNRPWQA